MKKINKLLVAFLAAFLVLSTSAEVVNAATREQGTDLAKFQGTNGKVGYESDKFSIVQLGGTYGGTFITQATYNSQVKASLNRGLRTHTYLWYGVGGSSDLGKKALDYYLPQVKTPKGSIVALDYEDGASASIQANTDAILYGMRRIRQAGYTPMYYSYKPYTMAHVDYNRIIKEFPNSGWIAGYPDYLVRSKPYYGVFPSMKGIGIWQFTSMYKLGGLDGNVDLIGITKNGYSQQPSKPNKPVKPSAPQISVDGYWGRDVTKSLQRVFGQYQDGVVSSQVRSNNLTSITYGHRGSLLIRSIQARLGVPVDGFIGPQTIRALQRHYGTYIDGRISKNSPMVRAMERSLNQNKF